MRDEPQDIKPQGIAPFNVLIAYEDVAGELRAQGLLERMTRALPSEDSDWLRCALWKFNDQANPLGIAEAAEQATQADLIIVAAHEREELPAVLEQWVHLWLLKKAGYPCALVALLERAESDADAPQGVHTYFETVAQKGKLAFFVDCEEGENFLSQEDSDPEEAESYSRHRWRDPGPEAPYN